MAFFDEDNISSSGIATNYRTPDQGVSAKSNSNISYNDYRKMTPTRGGNLNSGVLIPSGTTISAQDFHNSGGFTGGSGSFSTGSTKGQTTTSLSGVFSSTAMSHISGGVSSSSIGQFGLGATGGTSGAIVRNPNASPALTVGNVAQGNNNAVSSITGIGISSAGLGGTMWLIIGRGGYQTGNVSASEWSKMTIRTLYTGGVLSIGGTNYYNPSMVFNRSDGWSFTNNGTTGVWTASFGSIGTVTYSSSAGYAGIYPFTVELD